MKLNYCEQGSKEWFDAKVGKVGGTRFGAVISGKKNRLPYELLNEKLNGYIEPDDYVSDDMLFGTENEPVARQLYSEQTGIVFEQVGMIESDFSGIHLASPDGLNQERGVVLEIKSTQNGYVHIQRFFEGVETSHLAQIINAFAVSDEVTAVHFVSYCPDRIERPLIAWVFTRDTEIKDGKTTTTIGAKALEGRRLIGELEAELKDMEQRFTF